MSRRVARPYAQALVAVVKPRGTEALEEARQALQRATSAFAALPDLLRAFELPGLPSRKKAQLLREVTKTLALPAEVGRLLVALQSHYRLRLLPTVAEEFAIACDRMAGVMRGKVQVPAPLAPEKLSALGRVLASLVGCQVRLQQETKPELVGGFVVRLGSLLFDGSLKRQLERFAGLTLPLGGPHAG